MPRENTYYRIQTISVLSIAYLFSQSSARSKAASLFLGRTSLYFGIDSEAERFLRRNSPTLHPQRHRFTSFSHYFEASRREAIRGL